MNQGEEVLKETVLVFRGASELREADRVELRWLVRSSGEARGGSMGRAVESRSERWRWSMDLVFRNYMTLGR